MARFEIEVGETEGFRHIGFQPPLDNELAANVRQEVESEVADRMMVTGCEVARPDQGRPYTEIGLMVIDSCDTDIAVARTVGRVTRKLVDLGHTTTVIYDMKSIGDGRYLFGGRSNI